MCNLDVDQVHPAKPSPDRNRNKQQTEKNAKDH